MGDDVGNGDLSVVGHAPQPKVDRLAKAKCGNAESGKQSLPAIAAVPGVRARVAPGGNLG